MDKERSEDLHPASDDIEEKVRQMLDPSLPDPAPDEKPAKKPITLQSVSDQIEEAASTPTVASAAKKVAITHVEESATSSAKKPKKVVIPIDHQQQEAETKPVKKKTEVKKITIADHDDSPAEVAEKLDEVIADLDPQKDTEDKVRESQAPSAPELVEADEDTEAKEGDASEDAPVDVAKPEQTEESDTVEIEEPEEIPLEEPKVVNDPETDKAVAEIVAAESDEILEIEDAVRDQEPAVTSKPAKTAKPKKGKKVLRKLLLSSLFIGVVAVLVTPTSRYFLLNSAGVRASSSLLIVDDTSGQPLKSAQVQIGSVSAVTDAEGKVRLDKLRLGKSQLTIQKSAFASVTRTVTIGWGSNPLGQIGLRLTGTQYSFQITDFLSGKAIAKATASTTEADAVGDDSGKIKLSLEKPGDQPFTVTIKRDGYRDEAVTIDPASKDSHNVVLVPARKHVYISKRIGTYDIYSSYIDGKDNKIVLSGSGKETDNLVLAPHPTDNVAAYVSTRAGQTNKAGQTLSSLLLINLDDNQTTPVTAAEQVRLISWSGDYLVYVQTTVDAGANAGDRYQLVSYNYKNNATNVLAKANFFNDVIGVGSTIYYAQSSAYQSGTANLHQVHADGTNNTVVFNQEVWNIFRTAYDHLTLSVQQEWYDLQVGGKEPTKLNAAPAEQSSRLYIDSPDGKHSARIDERDGKPVLLLYDTTTKVEKELQTVSGLNYPVRWLNNSVLVYRVKSSQETADYAISLDGGKAVRIGDVTNSGAINRWLY